MGAHLTDRESPRGRFAFPGPTGGGFCTDPLTRGTLSTVGRFPRRVAHDTRLAGGVPQLLAGSASLRAGEPKPIWELTGTTAGPASEPVWMSYSPDGRAIVVVTARALPVRGEGSEYHLRVYDSHTRKERFNASLGTSKSFHWSDDLASFPWMTPS